MYGVTAMSARGDRLEKINDMPHGLIRYSYNPKEKKHQSSFQNTGTILKSSMEETKTGLAQPDPLRIPHCSDRAAAFLVPKKK